MSVSRRLLLVVARIPWPRLGGSGSVVDTPRGRVIGAAILAVPLSAIVVLAFVTGPLWAVTIAAPWWYLVLGTWLHEYVDRLRKLG